VVSNKSALPASPPETVPEPVSTAEGGCCVLQ
jgi:hypothetical protein